MSVLRIEVEADTGVAIATLDRPERRNALDGELLDRLRDAFDDLGGRSDVRAVVLTGAARVFCAGADVHALKSMDAEGTARFLALGQAVTALIAASPVPVIAAIAGFALGGGLELALACDIRIVETDAVLGFPEVRVGAIPGWGGTQRLRKIANASTAYDLVLSGRQVTAEQALRMGLVAEVTARGDVLTVACARATEIATSSPAAVRAAKTLLRETLDVSLPDGLRAEVTAAQLLAAHPDHAEGIAAFLEKRSPRWSGRGGSGP